MNLLSEFARSVTLKIMAPVVVRVLQANIIKLENGLRIGLRGIAAGERDDTGFRIERKK